MCNDWKKMKVRNGCMGKHAESGLWSYSSHWFIICLYLTDVKTIAVLVQPITLQKQFTGLPV